MAISSTSISLLPYILKTRYINIIKLKKIIYFSVSSVLNDDKKSYGINNLYDNNMETCWNSSHGTPQYISLQFKNYVNIQDIYICFQGGFVPKVLIF